MNKEYDLTIEKDFFLPIETEKDKLTIQNTLKDDLEIGTDNCPYTILFNNTNDISYHNLNNDIDRTNKENLYTLLNKKWSSFYSSNTRFLKNFQSFIENYDFSNNLQENDVSKSEYCFTQWIELKKETSFNHKYEYITWQHLDFLNKSPYFLQGMSYYNLTSPLVNLSIPIIFLIIPFILLKYFSKIPITFYNYKQLLCKQFSNHAIGKLFNICSNELSMEKKLTASFTVAFYFFTIYQNILSCIKFNKNIKFIHSFLFNVKQHIKHTSYLTRHIEYLSKTYNLKNYLDYIREKKKQLDDFYDELSCIQNNTFSLKQLFRLGDELKLFYSLYNDTKYNELMGFSFGVCCFHKNILSLSRYIKERKLSKCSFIKNNNDNKHNNDNKQNKEKYTINKKGKEITKQSIQEQFYIYHINDKSVLNNISLKQNYIITGPNASGKTTLIKTTLLNIIFSQQFGFGCYKNCNIIPYDNIYSYINIPDTSNRDSLFQAEARRCLNIIQDIERKGGRSFIIFDELYSGTNPEEAIITAKAFLQYLQERNIQFMLTTHFTELTKLNKKYNYKMMSYIESNKIHYTYKLKQGINKLKGGIKVLEDLDYPNEIIVKMKIQ